MSFELPENKSTDTCQGNDIHWRHAHQPDEQGRHDGNPYIVFTDFSRLGHTESRGGNQGYYSGTDTFENILHGFVFLELLKKQGDGQDNQEGGEDGSQGQGKCSWKAFQLIADKDGEVYGKDSRNGLRHGQQVYKLFLTEPSFLIDHFFFNERHHGIASTDGEQAYFEKCSECV